MDKLKLAWKLLGERARADRERGAVPTFLGPRGMLALMYRSITEFSEEQEDNSKYLLDLAVSALFAFSVALPDSDSFDDEDEPREEEPDGGNPPAESSEKVHREEETNDPRWTSVAPGTALPTVDPIRRSAMDE